MDQPAKCVLRMIGLAALALSLPRAAYSMDLSTALPAGQQTSIAVHLTDSLGVSYPRITTPVHGAPITSEFGWRRHPIFKRMRFHGGLDFGARVGTPVHAAAAGTIVKITRTKDRGLYVLVRHSGLFETGYSHLATIAPGIEVGSEVQADTVIGTVGTTGWSTGPHLDFEAFIDSNRVDPEPLLMKSVIPADRLPGEALLLVMSETLSERLEPHAATPMLVQYRPSALNHLDGPG